MCDERDTLSVTLIAGLNVRFVICELARSGEKAIGIVI